MSKLVFPGVSKPYRGFVSELRTWFQMIASFAERNPKSVDDINASIGVLASATGYTGLLSDQGVITDGDLFSVSADPDPIPIRATVVDGVITFEEV